MNGWFVAMAAFVLIVAMGLGFVLSVQKSTNQMLTHARRRPTIWRSAWLAAQVGFLLSASAVFGLGRYLVFSGADGEVRWLGVLWFVVGPYRMGLAEGAIGIVVSCTVVAAAIWGLKSWRIQQA